MLFTCTINLTLFQGKLTDLVFSSANVSLLTKYRVSDVVSICGTFVRLAQHICDKIT